MFSNDPTGSASWGNPEADTAAPLGIGEIATRFMRYDRRNPHVYQALARLTRRFIEDTGRRTVGMQRIIEIARWDEQTRTEGGEDFEINNDYAAYFARLIMLREADLADVFKLRSSEDADRWIALVKQGLVSI